MFDESEDGILIREHKNMFVEESKDTAKYAHDTESVYSTKTTESVASIFASNAEFYDSIGGKKLGTKKFDTMSYAPTEALLSGTSAILLLDLRDPEQYKLSHIKGSINFPSPNIARDKLIMKMWEFKNKEEKIIIIYHEDEKKVIEAAELLVEKEFTNIYIMTNGFDAFADENPDFIEGKTAYIANNEVTSTFSTKKPVKSLTSCPRF
jgi:rhodanese-related sulfurtransferase